MKIEEGNKISFDYINWKNVSSSRSAIVESFSFESNEFHTEEQWILYGHDIEKNEIRGYAMKDMNNIKIWKQLAFGDEEQIW